MKSDSHECVAGLLGVQLSGIHPQSATLRAFTPVETFQMWSTCTQTLNASLWFHLPRLTYQQKRYKSAAPAAAAAHICSVAGSFSQPSTAISCLSFLKRGNRFVPTAGTEEKGRWGRTASWPLEPGCVNLWHQLYLLLPANRMLRLPWRRGGLPSGSVLTPQVCPDVPKPLSAPLTPPERLCPLLCYSSILIHPILANRLLATFPQTELNHHLRGERRARTVTKDNSRQTPSSRKIDLR